MTAPATTPAPLGTAASARAGSFPPTPVTVGGAPSGALYTVLLGVFLTSETMLFVALISAHLHFASDHGAGPSLVRLLDVRGGLLNTAILVLSSLTMATAGRVVARRRENRFRLWLAATAALGLVFLVRQLQEFASLAGEGLGYTTSVAGSSFYLLTGFHAAHLAVGLLWLLSLLVVSWTRRRSKAEGNGVAMASMYWHYVDGVWVVLYVLLYVLPAFA